MGNAKIFAAVICLTGLAMSFVSAAVATPAAMKIFVDRQTGVSLRYPADLRPKTCGDGFGTGYESCTTFSREGQPDYFLIVTVRKLALQAAIVADDSFEKINGNWFRLGRLGTPGGDKAEAISGPGWRGISGVSSCGVQDAPGGPEHLSDCLTGIVSDGTRSVSIETDGRLDVDQARHDIVRSVKFSGVKK